MSNLTPQEVVTGFLEDIYQSEKDLEKTLDEANKRYRFTTKVISVVIAIIFIGIILSLLLIAQFSRDFQQIVVSMDKLNQQIVATQASTNDIKTSLSEVAKQTNPMQDLVQSTSSINHNISSMNEYFKGIEHNSISMRQSTGVIKNELNEMTQRFDNVNSNMSRVVYNVQQLSKNVP